jgi:hypothetical protein
MAMLEGIAEEKPELPVLGGVDLDASAAELRST